MPSSTRRGHRPQASTLKNELIDYEAFASAHPDGADRALAEAYGEYQRRLLEAGAMDFDDLIMVTSVASRPCPRWPSGTAAASGTCWSMSTRTPTMPSTS